MECSEPGLMRDEELLAYLAGERVSPAVEQHLAQCPRCSTRVADYRRQELALLSKLYRWDCPPNQVLGEYQLGLLAADTALAVKHHLLACVHCSAELSILSEFLQSDPVLVQRPAPAPDPEPARQNHHALPQQPGALLNRLLDHAGTSTRRIIAALLPPAPRLAYQRNATPHYILAAPLHGGGLHYFTAGRTHRRTRRYAAADRLRCSKRCAPACSARNTRCAYFAIHDGFHAKHR